MYSHVKIFTNERIVHQYSYNVLYCSQEIITLQNSREDKNIQDTELKSQSKRMFFQKDAAANFNAAQQFTIYSD